MLRFAIIGLGRFGSRLATNLAAAGQEVIAIDLDERLIEKLRDRVTLAVAMDATDEEALRMHGVQDVDAAVVGIGNNFEANAMVTVILKKMGVTKVYSRAQNATTAKILESVGADEVVRPEDESADRWSSRLVTPQFLSMFDLGPEHAIVEIRTPSRWVGRTLVELNLRADLGVHVVAVKKGAAAAHRGGRVEVPQPRQPLAADDVLVLMGHDADLARLPQDGEK